MSEETTVQSNDNAVNNPTTEGSKNNDVPYDRFAEVNTQKNDWKAQAEKLMLNLLNLKLRQLKQERQRW